jgi:glycosyltransferase involved in cell wall biosynthesis
VGGRPLTRRFSVVVPAYNEGPRMATTVAALRAALDEVDTEVVVVDDGSQDATADIAEAAGADVVLRQPRNAGKGAAVRAGFAVAAGEAIAYTDADLAYPPEQLLAMLRVVEAGLPFVAGSRRHEETVTLIRARRMREVTGRVFNLATGLIVGTGFRDTQCGLKAFRAGEGKLLFECGLVDGFAFDVELFVMAKRFGIPVTEVPVQVRNADRSTVHVSRDSRRMIQDLVRIRRWAAGGTYERRRSELPGR